MEISSSLIPPMLEFNSSLEVTFSHFHSIVQCCTHCSGSITGTTVAGITSSAGGSYSQLNNPSAIVVDSSNRMYILDTSNCRILRWQVGEPLGFPVAGDHGCGSTLDRIDTSYAMFIDPQFNIYISEYANHRVTLWSSSNVTAGTLVNLQTANQTFTRPMCPFFRWPVEMVRGVLWTDFTTHGVCTRMPIKLFSSSIAQIIA